MKTLSPRFLRIRPNEAAVRPLPKPETTPPVTKINFAIYYSLLLGKKEKTTHTFGVALHDYNKCLLQ